MKNSRIYSKFKVIPLLIIASLFFGPLANAATVTYSLNRTTGPTNVDDTEGRWQFVGGEVMIGSTVVGYYTQKKRVSFAIPINKSSMEMTIIWGFGSHNFTVQGEHLFSTGAQVGGVSAYSPGFSVFEGATFTGNTTSITIDY